MEPHEFKKHSRIGAVLSAVGVILILISVILFLNLNTEKNQALLKSSKSLIGKKDTIKILEKKLQKDIVECTAALLKEKMNNGNPLYLFTLGISDTLLVHQLTRVDYFFNHPSYNPQLKTSSDSLNNFSISYKGWGCMTEVPVYLHYKKKIAVDTIFFPMCNKTKVILVDQMK